jgi:hypothetical protein
MPLLKSSGSPNDWRNAPPAVDVATYRCWSTMNGAVARPAMVFTIELSLLSIRPLLFAS